MAGLALIAWIATAVAGVYLLAIWLIEYDPGFRLAAGTRLPIPVMGGHILFAVAGLVSWVIYLITDKPLYRWAAVGALALIAVFGFTMAVRWLEVYRARPIKDPLATGPPGSFTGPTRPAELAVPPERHLPVSGVIVHGIFAIITIVLVVLTVMRVG